MKRFLYRNVVLPARPNISTEYGTLSRLKVTNCTFLNLKFSRFWGKFSKLILESLSVRLEIGLRF